MYDRGEDDKEIDDNDKEDSSGDTNGRSYSADSRIPDDNRSRIYQFIQKNPGAHLRKIVKELGLAMGDTQYHLNILEKSGQIKSRRSSLRRYYYPVAIVTETYEIILAFLRQETSRDILVYLMEHPGSTQSNIAGFKHFSSPTINWHMSRLIDDGIVESVREGRTVRYSVKGDFLQSVGHLLKSYHPNVWNKLASRLAETFLELSSAATRTRTTDMAARERDEQKQTGKDDDHYDVERRR